MKEVSEQIHSPDEEKRMQEAIGLLTGEFGIENFSNLELYHLRRIAKDVIERGKADPDNASGVIPSIEICSRFFSELYAIDYNVLRTYAEDDREIENRNEYIRRIRERAHLI